MHIEALQLKHWTWTQGYTFLKTGTVWCVAGGLENPPFLHSSLGLERTSSLNVPSMFNKKSKEERHPCLFSYWKSDLPYHQRLGPAPRLLGLPAPFLLQDPSAMPPAHRERHRAEPWEYRITQLSFFLSLQKGNTTNFLTVVHSPRSLLSCSKMMLYNK